MARCLEAGASGASVVVDVTTLYVVRHGHAGERGHHEGPDIERPLSERGRRQAEGLLRALADERFVEVWSSPAVRCLQTVEPLAESRKLPVLLDDHLMEGQRPADTIRWLVARLGGGSIVASSHGDLIPELLLLAERDDCKLPRDARWAKGSCWVLRRKHGRWDGATYIAPAA